MKKAGRKIHGAPVGDEKGESNTIPESESSEELKPTEKGDNNGELPLEVADCPDLCDASSPEGSESEEDTESEEEKEDETADGKGELRLPWTLRNQRTESAFSVKDKKKPLVEELPSPGANTNEISTNIVAEEESKPKQSDTSNDLNVTQDITSKVVKHDDSLLELEDKVTTQISEGEAGDVVPQDVNINSDLASSSGSGLCNKANEHLSRIEDVQPDIEEMLSNNILQPSAEAAKIRAYLDSRDQNEVAGSRNLLSTLSMMSKGHWDSSQAENIVTLPHGGNTPSDYDKIVTLGLSEDSKSTQAEVANVPMPLLIEEVLSKGIPETEESSKDSKTTHAEEADVTMPLLKESVKSKEIPETEEDSKCTQVEEAIVSVTLLKEEQSKDIPVPETEESREDSKSTQAEEANVSMHLLKEKVQSKEMPETEEDSKSTQAEEANVTMPLLTEKVQSKDITAKSSEDSTRVKEANVKKPPLIQKKPSKGVTLKSSVDSSTQVEEMNITKPRLIEKVQSHAVKSESNKATKTRLMEEVKSKGVSTEELLLKELPDNTASDNQPEESILDRICRRSRALSSEARRIQEQAINVQKTAENNMLPAKNVDTNLNEGKTERAEVLDYQTIACRMLENLNNFKTEFESTDVQQYIDELTKKTRRVTSELREESCSSEDDDDDDVQMEIIPGGSKWFGVNRFANELQQNVTDTSNLSDIEESNETEPADQPAEDSKEYSRISESKALQSMELKGNMAAASSKIKEMRADLAQVRDLLGRSMDMLKLPTEDQAQLLTRLEEDMAKLEKKALAHRPKSYSLGTRRISLRKGMLTRCVLAAAADAKKESADAKTESADAKTESADATTESADAKAGSADAKESPDSLEAKSESDVSTKLTEQLEKRYDSSDNVESETVQKVEQVDEGSNEKKQVVSSEEVVSSADALEEERGVSSVEDILDNVEGPSGVGDSPEGEESDSDEAEEVRRNITSTIEMQVASME